MKCKSNLYQSKVILKINSLRVGWKVQIYNFVSNRVFNGTNLHGQKLSCVPVRVQAGERWELVFQKA